MAAESIRGIDPSGKRLSVEEALAPPERWLAELRALAAQEAARAGTTIPEAVRTMSATYVHERERLASLAGTSARTVGSLGFFVARDLPKALVVLHELWARALLPVRTRAKVLDLGAGLGTTTFGLARLAERTGAYEALEVDAVELDGGALERMRALSTSPELAPIALRTHASRIEPFVERATGTYDLILIGLAWNELALDPAEKLRLLDAILARLADDGVLLIVEPALHAPSRALMGLRDALRTRDDVSILAPCTHDAPCPMLAAGDRDWCHAELARALPEPEAAVARAAGLRDEKPTFSFLALGKRRTGSSALHRIVSRPFGSKGKTESIACGGGRLVRLRSLDRDRVEPALSTIERGALVSIAIARDGDTLRLGRDATLERGVPHDPASLAAHEP